MPTKEDVLEMVDDGEALSFMGWRWRSRVEGTNSEWVLIFEPIPHTIWKRLWLVITRWEPKKRTLPRSHMLTATGLKSWSDGRGGKEKQEERTQ